MEDRVKKVEDGLSELKTEIRLMTHTLESINNTLIEFKSIHKTVTELTISQAHTEKNIDDADSKVKLLFKKYDNVEKRLSDVEKSDAIQSSKTGSFERLFWIIVTTIGGGLTAYYSTR